MFSAFFRAQKLIISRLKSMRKSSLNRANIAQNFRYLKIWQKKLKVDFLQFFSGYHFVFNWSDTVNMRTIIFRWQNTWDTSELVIISHRHRVVFSFWLAYFFKLVVSCRVWMSSVITIIPRQKTHST